MRRQTIVVILGLSFAAALLAWVFWGGSSKRAAAPGSFAADGPVGDVSDERAERPIEKAIEKEAKVAASTPAPTRPRKDPSSESTGGKAANKAEPSTEVIQEKRQIRVKKKPKQRSSGATSLSLDGFDGDPGPSEANSSPKSPRMREFAVSQRQRQLQGERERAKIHSKANFIRKSELTEKDFEAIDKVPERPLTGFENRAVAAERVVAKPMTETSFDPMSTFSIDVDTGAYTLARARLREGYLPKKEHVRIEEFLNYFHYDYPQPANGPFAAHLEVAPDPFGSPGQHIIRIGIQGRDVAESERPPAHLTFLVDVSGSMFGHDKLELAREALELVTRNLRTDDTVAIVTYARGAHVELWPAGAKESDLVMGAIAGLSPGGSSALDEGLDLAYRVASTHFYAGHINRVIVMGDGRANVGDTQPDKVLARIRAGVEDGVTMSTIGFGAKAFNDQMMERLADNGNGNYFFVDSYREAERVFRDRLCGTIHAIANDVKIQVEFNPATVRRFRLLGYENRKLEHHEFRDDKVDAGEIGAGHSVTALYAVELHPNPTGTLAAVRVRHKEPGQTVATESEFQLHAEELLADVRRASPDFKFSAAVALFAEALRGDAEMSEARISLVQEIASEGITAPGDQIDRTEFVALLEEVRPYFAN